MSKKYYETKKLTDIIYSISSDASKEKIEQKQ